MATTRHDRLRMRLYLLRIKLKVWRTHARLLRFKLHQWLRLRSFNIEYRDGKILCDQQSFKYCECSIKKLAPAYPGVFVTVFRPQEIDWKLWWWRFRPHGHEEMSALRFLFILAAFFWWLVFLELA